MSPRPTLFQTLFNQPSQTYATQQPREPGRNRRRGTRRLHPSSPPLPAANSEPFPSILSRALASSNLTPPPTPLDHDADVPRPNGLDPISNNVAKTVTPRNISLSTLQLGPQPAPQSPDSDDELFYTPLSSPRSSAAMPPEAIAPKPIPSACSSVSSSAPDDDLFSSRSAVTSATSLSASLTVSNGHHPIDPRRTASYHPSKSRNGTSLAEWSKDVRWLVPPDVASLSHTSPVSGSLIQGLDLVDVEYEHVPLQSKSRVKSGRKSRQSTSEPMSAVLEEEEDEEHATPSHLHARTVSSPANVRGPRPALSRSSSISTRTVTLPTPLPVSSGTLPGTGYTGLTLPRAAYTPSKHPGRVSSSVDITRSGLAQTAMSTISISRHAAAPSSRPLRFSRLKPSAHTPERLRATLPSPLSFGSHTPPPSKVHSGQVLVQVWAVGLDGLDSLIVDERAGKSDSFGYVPGRSFVGRAVECGWEVNSVSKGDWVCGITEVRKCGALSEFIVVDRRRLHRSPRPSPRLTVDQIALLPLAGVPAHRAVRTFAHLPRGSRALVLHAHEGAGLLATQELAVLGFTVTAQVPGAWGGPEEKHARTGGARDVRCGSAVDVVRDVRAEEFDGVVDTLGGKGIWDACRRVLRTSGQFTTLVGDAESGIPTANAHFKSNMRSLHRAFVKKDHKSVGYEWISPVADVDAGGEDVRDSLAVVTRMAADSILAPHVGRVLPFERAPDAFTPDPDMKRSMLSLGSTAVVRIVD